MTSIHTLTEERRMFFSDLRFNKHRFIDFLGMMAKHHRHPLSAQIGLFFHGRAADEAYAPPAVWESLRTQVRKEARGIPVLMGEEGQEEIGYLYDISDTRDPTREDLRTLLWHYDDVRDGAFLRAQLGSKAQETQAAVMDACRVLAEESADEKERALVALGAAYVVLLRLGLHAEEEAGLPLILTEYSDVDAEKTLTGIQRIAQRILGPVARHIREEARNHEKGNDLSGRTHPSLADAGGSGSDRNREGNGRRSALEGTSGTIRSVEGFVLSAGGAAGISRSFSGDDQDPAAPVGGAAKRDAVDAPRSADGVPEVLGRVRRRRSMGGTGAAHEGVVSLPVGGTGRDPEGGEQKGERADRQRDVGESVPGGGRGGTGGRSTVRLGRVGTDAPEIPSGTASAGVEKDAEGAGSERVSDTNRGALSGEVPTDLREGGGEHPAGGADLSGERAEAQRNRADGEGVSDGGASALTPLDLSGIDYAADMSSTRGKRAVFARNLAAIRVMKHLEEQETPPTGEQLHLLRSYSGFGGMPEAFDPSNKAWAKEYDALRTHLTEAEFSSARASILNAHYTPPEVIEGIYEGLSHLGFQGGNVLEPSCGAGRFFDAMPKDMRAGSRLVGVEVDALSARIARLAHPDAEIAQQGFERTRFADSSFDLAISNVPFGDEIITGDPKYLGERLRIHDYFLSKMIDEVRPGGLVVAITSKGTMDKENERVRSKLADKAHLVTALRLPETTFSAAGTRVISDLLIFRKKDPERTHAEERKDTFAAVDWESVLYLPAAGENINKYFYHNREQVLGEFSTRSGPYGREQSVIAPEGQNIKEAITERFSSLPAAVYMPREEPLPIPQDQRKERASMGFYVEDGALCFVDTDGVKQKTELKEKERAHIVSAVHLRDAGHALLAAQQEECTNEELYALQKKLTQLYEDHVQRYGRIVQDKTLKRTFETDPGYNFIRAFEIYDSKKNFIRKADIFTERTIVPQHVPTESASAADALAISMQQKGGVDLSYMAELTKRPASDLIAALEFHQIFYDEREGYVLSDAYLSGDIRGKMEHLEKIHTDIEKELKEDAAGMEEEQRAALAARLFRIQKNYAALEEVRPKDLEIGEISCGLGVSWLPPRYIETFINEHFQPAGAPIVVNHSAETGAWEIKRPADAHYNPATMAWGTKEKNAYDLLEAALNFRTPVVKVPSADDPKKTVVDHEKTIAAQMKQQEIKDAFETWLIKDPQRVQFITDYYNRHFNNIRPRQYSGAHLTFPGMSNAITLNAHQKDAVAHSLYGGSTLFAHCVGAGKTFEMVASIMEAKRLGISHKALMIVPGHLTEQTGEEFQRLYPRAKILVATKKDFEKQNRRAFIARVATQNLDAVVMSFEQFKRIKVSKERQEALYRSELNRIKEALENERSSAWGKTYSIGQLEKKKKKLKAKLETLQKEGEKERDGVIDFEELGVDRLCVDEAHYFKNLYTPTRLSRVAGVNASESDRAWDLYLKCQYINEITNNKGVIFATGTPVSNSMTELFTMQRYLSAPRLAAQKLSHFDAWAANFGEITVGMELKPEGRDYQLKTRFAKFHNLPELMNMFKEFADIRTADMLRGTIKVPEAEYIVERLQPSPEQKEIIDTLVVRAQDIRAGKKPLVPKADGTMTEDSMLLITNAGRNLALDQRIIHPTLPDHPGSKINRCVKNVLATYRETMERKGTQIIFCDQSTATGKGRGSFNVYDDIRAKLIRAGIPKEQIAFVQEMKTEKQKEELFQKMREGEVRVLLGSTDTLGVGTNVQDKLIATHDLSVPWRPADLAQRMGRIIRPGNENEKVKIFRYVTEGTFDAYMWQIVENKQRFIAQIMTSKTPARSMQDVDETVLSYAEIKAIATGSPFIKEKMTLENDLSRIQIAKSAYLSQQHHLQNLIQRDYPAQIKEKKDELERLLDDQQRMEECTLRMDGKERFAIRMNDVLYTDPKEAGNAWLEMQKNIPAMLRFEGEYKGLKFRIVIDHMTQTPMLALSYKSTYRVRIGARPQDTFLRLKHLTDNIIERIAKQREDIVQTENNLVRAKEEYGRPFVHAEEEREKTLRLMELEQRMRASEDAPFAAMQCLAQKSLPEKPFAVRIEEIAHRAQDRKTTPQQAAAR